MTLTVVIPFDLHPDVPLGGAGSQDMRLASVRVPKSPVVVAFVDNRKPKAGTLLRAVGDVLVEKGIIESYFVYEKRAMVPLTDVECDEIGGRANVVISGVGDCGGCTACSVTDALRMLDRGFPAFIVATRAFETLVDATERQYGLLGMNRLYVDHPVWSRDPGWFEHAASRLEPVITGVVTGGMTIAPTNEAGEPAARSVFDALEGLRAILDTDGYGLAVEMAGDGLALAISADPDTCADCLAPAGVIAGIAHDMLGKAGFDIPTSAITVNLPSLDQKLTSAAEMDLPSP